MRKKTMEEREFDIHEVKLALNNAAEILKIIPDTLEHFLECGLRGGEPDHEHRLLLLMAIKGLIPMLRQADEYLSTPKGILRDGKIIVPNKQKSPTSSGIGHRA